MQSQRRLHGSSASFNNEAVLILGPSGSGKSDLVMRLLGRGFSLVADDQVDVVDGLASPPSELAGLLEVRGLGILRLPAVFPAPLRLVIQIGLQPERMPLPTMHPELALPMIQLDSASAGAADRIILALECAAGRITQVAGAFSA